VRCLFLIPPGGGRTLSLRLPDSPAADALLLEAGISWEHAWIPGRADVQVQLDSTVGNLHLRIPGGHEGFVRGETPAVAAGPWTRRTTTANTQARRVCIRPRARGGPP